MINKKMKLSNKLLLNYIIVIMLAAIFIIIFVFGYMMYSFFEDVPLVMWDDENYSIKVEESQELNQIVKYGGFYEVINDDLQIVYEKNSPYDSDYEYTMVEFLRILVSGSRDGFNTEMKVDLDTDNIVIIGLPKSVKGISISHTKVDKASVREYVKKIIVALIVLFILASILIYSKITSKAFITPIMELLKSFEKMKNGEYNTRIKVEDSVKEIVQVKEAFNHMARKIQEENELKMKSENVRKQMILDISHDLKNPLTSIQGYSEFLIKNDNLNREKNLEILKTINKNSIRANHLIEKLFEYSKLQSDEYVIQKKLGDICEFMREAFATHIAKIEDEGFLYEVDIPDDEVYIEFNGKELDRVINNILSNAIKYNKAGTKIYIKVENMKDSIKIIIGDDGIGIPKEFRERIFEPFMRVDESRNSNTGGTGLGLAIAQKIISRHNGIIKLNEESDGCEFEIWINK